MTDFRALCAELAALARREHYYCEDSWYSCPKATDGCADDSQGTDCNCGADAHNAKVDELLAALPRWSNPPQSAPEGPSDEELLELMPQTMRDDLASVSRLSAQQVGLAAGVFRTTLNVRVLEYARAVLARFGTPNLAETRRSLGDTSKTTPNENV